MKTQTPWERFEASAYLEPTDFVQCYLPLRGETYRRAVKFNPIDKYPEAIHFIRVGRRVDPGIFYRISREATERPSATIARRLCRVTGLGRLAF